MFELRDQFIKDNRNKLQVYYAKVSDKERAVMGFGYRSPQETIKAVLDNGDNSQLPLCLLHLFMDFEEPETREFVLNAFQALYDFEYNSLIKDPVTAYVHAYCLSVVNADEQSYAILKALGQQCFPPALVTMGDACIAHHRIKDAVSYYVHAIDHGYINVFNRLRKIVRKDSSFPRTFLVRIVGVGHFFRKIVGITRQGFYGEHVLYLDFYGLRHHLNSYWAHSKSERKSLRKSAQGVIS